MRYLTFPMREALQAESTDKVAVLLATITHPDLAEPIRVSSHGLVTLSADPFALGVRSRGADYLHLVKSYALPDDPETGAPSGQIVLADINGKLARGALPLIAYPTIDFEIVLASTPDLVEDAFTDDIEVASATWENGALTLELQAIDYDEPVPAYRISRRYAPGLHK